MNPVLGNMPWLHDNFQQLSVDIQNKRLPHALLFQERKGTGANEFSNVVATFALCNNIAQIKPGSGQGPQNNLTSCGQCKSCQLLHSGTHPDLRRLQPEGVSKSIGINAIREQFVFFSNTPQIALRKILLIEDAHRLNRNAANALLKMLEEPAGESLLLLTTHQPQLLLPTVRSRCVSHNLSMPSQQQSLDYLLYSGLDQQTASDAITEYGQAPVLALHAVKEGLLTDRLKLKQQISELEFKKISPMLAAKELNLHNFTETLDYLIECIARKAKPQVDNTPELHSLYTDLIKVRHAVNQNTNPMPLLNLQRLLQKWPVQ